MLKEKSRDIHFALVRQENKIMSDRILFQQFLQQRRIEKKAKVSSLEEKGEETQR